MDGTGARGLTWTSYEHEDLARAWLHMSEDTMTGTSQIDEVYPKRLRIVSAII